MSPVLFLAAITAVYAARTICPSVPAHTAAYDDFRAGRLASTDLYIDVYDSAGGCAAASNKQMRDRWSNLEHDITGFDCDHIVDVTGVPGLADGAGRDIAANKIPALARWNSGMGALCWRDAEVEKRAIYGDAVVDAALAAVRGCAVNTTVNTASADAIAWEAVAIVSLSGLAVVVMVVVVALCARNGCRKPLAPAVL